MSETGLPALGGCRCGQVRLAVSTPPMLTMACHCSGCQRMTGSAFSLSAGIPSQGFAVTAGEPVIGGLHGPEAHHYFCPHCMSWMFTRAVGMDWFVNLRPTMLDAPRWQAPFIETYASQKVPWATTPAVHSFPKFPSVEDYQALTAAYADWAAAQPEG